MCLGSAAVSPTPAIGATTFVVNRTGDGADNNLADSKCDTSLTKGSQCTLRAAIQEANDTLGADTITFNITSSSKTIAPASPLPEIIQKVTINGYTQSGAATNSNANGNNSVLKILVDGINAGAGVNGLDVEASQVTIRGLVIQRFDGAGIVLGSSSASVRGNYIGTSATGTAKRGNATGIEIIGNLNTVGGAAPADRNLISGNTGDGIHIHGEPAQDNIVLGNFIGTTKNGSAGLGNSGYGVFVDGASENTVGGTSAGARNVISGNHFGVEVWGPGVEGTVISGNYVGTDVTGTVSIENEQIAVQLYLANSVMIGGDTVGERNVISGNHLSGVNIFGDNNYVQGNYIGVDATGSVVLGNSDGVGVYGTGNHIGGTTAAVRNVISGNRSYGVLLTYDGGNFVQGNRIGSKADGTGDLGNQSAGIKLIGSDDNMIGGAGGAGNQITGNTDNGVDVTDINHGNVIQGNSITANDGGGVSVVQGNPSIAGNVIAGNVGAGVAIGSLASGVTITANQIVANGALGIDLDGGTEDAFGVTANDAADGDTGPNGLQNFPVLTSAIRSNSSHVTIVSGSLNSNVSTQFTIELFLAVPDPSGHGEAQMPLATQNVTTNSGGDKTFAFAVAGLAVGMQLTATATATSAGRTSEFSANVAVAAGL